MKRQCFFINIIFWRNADQCIALGNFFVSLNLNNKIDFFFDMTEFLIIEKTVH